MKKDYTSRTFYGHCLCGYDLAGKHLRPATAGDLLGPSTYPKYVVGIAASLCDAVAFFP